MNFAWFGLKLLGIGKWLKETATALLGIVRRYPWPSLVIALCGLLAVIWWHDSRTISGLRSANGQLSAQIGQMKAASKANLAAQLEQKRRVEQHYKDLAHEADKQHAEQLAYANDALARYIAAHRLRGPAPSNSGGSGSATEGGSPGVSQDASAEAGLVAVSENNLRVCAADYAYAKAAYDWAQGLAEPARIIGN